MIRLDLLSIFAFVGYSTLDVDEFGRGRKLATMPVLVRRGFGRDGEQLKWHDNRMVKVRDEKVEWNVAVATGHCGE